MIKLRTLPNALQLTVQQVELWCLHGEDLGDFSGGFEARAATPSDRRTLLMVQADLKLMELIEVERREFVVHESVAVNEWKSEL